MSKERGFLQKYEVKKLTNPDKKMYCVVLEFDDKLSRAGIVAFAEACRAEGYENLYLDLIAKCKGYENAEVPD